MTGRSFLDEIAAQPTALRAVRERFGRADNVFADWAARWREAGQPPLVLTGMGASLFALESANAVLALAGVPSCVVATSELVGVERHRLDGAFLVVVSQSGESTEVKELLAAADRARVHAVTNHAASSLAGAAGAVADVGVVSDRSVAIVTYSASLAALVLLAVEIAGADRAQYSDQLDRIADEIDEGRAMWADAVHSAVDAICRGRSMSVIGWGAGIGVAHEAGLLFKEAARYPAEGMGADQFRHGAVELVDERHTTIVLANRAEEGDHEDRSGHIAELTALAGSVIVVGESLPHASAASGVRHIRTVERRTPLGGLADIVPLQLLAAGIASASGFEPGVFRNTTPVIADRPGTNAPPMVPAGTA
jgi:glucosamine--fructose-6-phosphate aminotransferase (isomerizing)